MVSAAYVALRRRQRRVMERYLAAILRHAEYWNLWHRKRFPWIHMFRAKLGCDIRPRGHRMVQEDLSRVYMYLIRSSAARLAADVKRAIHRCVDESGLFGFYYIKTHPLGPKKIVYLRDEVDCGLILAFIGELLATFRSRIPEDLRELVRSGVWDVSGLGTV